MTDKTHPRSPTSTASEAIQTLLYSKIAQSGPLQISQFIEIVLGHSDHGYYRRQNPIGADGDFTTAAEISGLFGEMCGFFLAHMYEIAGQPGTAQIVELGPGRGSLMADMLHVWAHIMPVMANLPIQLVETSPKLRTIQKQCIKAKAIAWYDDVQSLPDTALFGIANEFFDALPIDQAVWRQGAWRHRLVTDVHGALSFIHGPALTLPELKLWQITNDQHNMTEGRIAEYCPAVEPIVRQVASRIARHGGAFLIIDYGKNDNFSDSLQAVEAHKPVDLLYQPGNADISHWVDFAALRRATINSGARFIGPITQANFLMRNGLRERAENAARFCDANGRRTLLSAVNRLVGAHHMGTAFKVGLIIPAGDGVPVGFGGEDLS